VTGASMFRLEFHPGSSVRARSREQTLWIVATDNDVETVIFLDMLGAKRVASELLASIESVEQAQFQLAARSDEALADTQQDSEGREF
jgi:hypothetical protein